MRGWAHPALAGGLTADAELVTDPGPRPALGVALVAGTDDARELGLIADAELHELGEVIGVGILDALPPRSQHPAHHVREILRFNDFRALRSHPVIPFGREPSADKHTLSALGVG